MITPPRYSFPTQSRVIGHAYTTARVDGRAECQCGFVGDRAALTRHVDLQRMLGRAA